MLGNFEEATNEDHPPPLENRVAKARMRYAHKSYRLRNREVDGALDVAVERYRANSRLDHPWQSYKLFCLEKALHQKQPKRILELEKARDVAGLYLDLPERALVWCVDKKSQIQSLDRSQPVLPLMPETPERRSHDYTRHGTTSPFATLVAAPGEVIGKYYKRHRM